MIVATPLDIPKIEPDSWKVFWNIWNSHAKDLIKIRMNDGSPIPVGSNAIWMGLDIFKSEKGYETSWAAPFYDIKNELPKMYDSICQLPFNIERVRIIQSLKDIPSHSDDAVDRWNIRAIFHCTDIEDQWYFTKPGDRSYKVFLNMPLDTNWFAYNNKYCWHGSVYNDKHRKLLIQIYLLNYDISPVLNKSVNKYKVYTIEL